jgi:hypothetical protein
MLPSKATGAPAWSSVSQEDILRLGWADSCQGGLSSRNSSEEVKLELELSFISVGIRWGSVKANSGAM